MGKSSNFAHPRPRTEIVLQALLPEIKFRKSLRADVKSSFNHSGQKRGISVTPNEEMVVFKTPRLLARQQIVAQDLIVFRARNDAYHARICQEIKELKLFFSR